MNDRVDIEILNLKYFSEDLRFTRKVENLILQLYIPVAECG